MNNYFNLASASRNLKNKNKPNIKINTFHFKNDVSNNVDNVKPFANKFTAPPGTFTPQSISKIYGLNNNSLPEQLGLGITVAVIIAYRYPNLQQDFNTYCINYNLPLQNLTIKSFGTKNDMGWAEECCLDVQMIHSIAPYAKIMVVQAKDASFNNLLTAIKYAVNNGANVISMSWGGGEYSSIMSQYNSYFSTVPNVCFVASSGDTSNQINFPASSSNVIAVGGTTLTALDNGLRNTETPWFNNSGGAGNGYSNFELKPLYQQNLTAITGNKRSIPDISLIADPNTGFVVYCNGSYGIFGGTSVSAPLMSGLLAIANQIRKNNNKPLLSSVNTQLYNLQQYMYQTIYANNPTNSNYTSSVPYTANMYDIVSGRNGIYSTNTGYDLASGLGSLNANVFCNTLNNI